LTIELFQQASIDEQQAAPLPFEAGQKVTDNGLQKLLDEISQARETLCQELTDSRFQMHVNLSKLYLKFNEQLVQKEVKFFEELNASRSNLTDKISQSGLNNNEKLEFLQGIEEEFKKHELEMRQTYAKAREGLSEEIASVRLEGNKEFDQSELQLNIFLNEAEMEVRKGLALAGQVDQLPDAHQRNEIDNDSPLLPQVDDDLQDYAAKLPLTCSDLKMVTKNLN